MFSFSHWIRSHMFFLWFEWFRSTCDFFFVCNSSAWVLFWNCEFALVRKTKKNKWFVFEVKREKFSFFSQKCGRRQGKVAATPLVGGAPCMTGALAREGGGPVAIRLWTTTSTPVENKVEGGVFGFQKVVSCMPVGCLAATVGTVGLWLAGRGH